MTGVVVSDKFKEHETGRDHPENPARMDAVRQALAAPGLSGALLPIEPRVADRKDILLIHSERLYDEILATREHDRTVIDEDTIASSKSAEVALLAVGAVLSAVDSVLEGQVTNAFAFVRPPGHHAKPDKAMGFCLFNNVAIAAQHAIRNRGVERVLVVDWDVHHGNGTQKAFFTSPEVLYISIHQWPHYPGTGAVEELGKDAGEGYTVNVPVPAGMGDSEYLQIFREVVVPVGREFSPGMVLISAGFDAHRRDPLGGMLLTHQGFARMTREVLSVAEVCGGRAVFALEGGYDPEGLERSIVSVLEVAGGLPTAPEGLVSGGSADALIQTVRRAHRGFWECFPGR